MTCEGKKLMPDIPTKEYLEKKFSANKYEEKYIVKCLQRDILDFQEYTKEQIRRVKATQEELIRLIQESVNEVLPDYEVKLYGSHATNLCLQWSDLDVVLINKKNYSFSSLHSLQGLYINLLEKPWKKTIKLIDSALIPIIKMTSSEHHNSMHIDISIQDSKHYGLKCVDLVKSFMKEYEALEPLIFALKNILKNANLNDPYTVKIKFIF
jgi:non-canonical poly(A) RNA polymerase PAPD5/7